jgi:hypothetical protein
MHIHLIASVRGNHDILFICFCMRRLLLQKLALLGEQQQQQQQQQQML